jgi:hypothetical protein
VTVLECVSWGALAFVAGYRLGYWRAQQIEDAVLDQVDELTKHLEKLADQAEKKP